MIEELELYRNHLKNISIHEWEELFHFLPKLNSFIGFDKNNKNNNKNNKLFQLALDLMQKINKLDLIFVFDWESWKEGWAIIQNQQFEYTQLDLVTLGKLLTTILRCDRFDNGYLENKIIDGTISKIITAIKSKCTV